MLRHKDPCWSRVEKGINYKGNENTLGADENFGGNCGWWLYAYVMSDFIESYTYKWTISLYVNYMSIGQTFTFFPVFGGNLLSVCSSLQLNEQLMDPWDEWFYLASVLTLEVYVFFLYIWQVNCHEVLLYLSSSFCHLPHSSILPVSRFLFA